MALFPLAVKSKCRNQLNTQKSIDTFSISTISISSKSLFQCILNLFYCCIATITFRFVNNFQFPFQFIRHSPVNFNSFCLITIMFLFVIDKIYAEYIEFVWLCCCCCWLANMHAHHFMPEYFFEFSNQPTTKKIEKFRGQPPNRNLVVV